MMRHIKASSTFLGQTSSTIACQLYLWQYLPKFPWITFMSHKSIELVNHLLRIILGFKVDRQHSRSVAYTQHLLACQLPMNITGKSGEKCNILHMRLIVKYCLIDMRYAPAERDVVFKQFRQLSSGSTRICITPCTERHKKFVVTAKRHISMHHRTNAYCRQALNLRAVGSLNILTQIGIAILQSCPYCIYAVSP